MQRIRFLSLSATDFTGWVILCGVICPMHWRMFTASLDLFTRGQWHTPQPSCNNKSSPNIVKRSKVPWRIKKTKSQLRVTGLAGAPVAGLRNKRKARYGYCGVMKGRGGGTEVGEVQAWSVWALEADVDPVSFYLNIMGSHWAVLKGSLWLLCGEYPKVSEWAKAEAGRSIKRLLPSKQGMKVGPTKVGGRGQMQDLFLV